MSATQPLVSQPDWMPSRKVMVGALAGVITAGVTQWTTKFATQYPDYFAFLDSGAWQTFVPLGAMFLAGYIIRERAIPSAGPTRGAATKPRTMTRSRANTKPGTKPSASKGGKNA